MLWCHASAEKVAPLFLCVCAREREWRMWKESWPKGIVRPCWGMITELCRIKTSSHTHSCTVRPGLQRHPAPVCMHAAPRWPDKIQTKRERMGGREENKLTASSLFHSSVVGTDRETWQPSRLLYLHGCHFISMSFTGCPATRTVLTHNLQHWQLRCSTCLKWPDRFSSL